MSPDERNRKQAYAVLAHVSWFRYAHLAALKPVLGEPEDIINSAPEKIRKLDILGEALRKELALAVENLDGSKLIADNEKKGIHIITIEDESYPARLREIDNPPLVLFCKGDTSLLDKFSIAIVGSRKASRYGLAQSEKIAANLAELGIVIVSGMALGIDGAAHRGALGIRGKTIAVLGSGVDIIYPGEHKEIYGRIINEGLVVSEYSPGSEPKAQHFPERNRIISALSHAVIVAEAPRKSGALITARIAVDQGREVFAVPGLVTSPGSRGCHYIIKCGQAGLIENADDVLTALGISKQSLLYGEAASMQQMSIGLEDEKGDLKGDDADAIERKKSGYTPLGLESCEKQVLEHISYEGTHINELARMTNLSIAELSALLTMLEVKGYIATDSGGYYQRL